MTTRKFLTGSKYFFNGIPGFAPHDTDYNQLDPNQSELYRQYKLSNGEIGDVFSYRAGESVSTYQQLILDGTVPWMGICSFLQVDFVEAIGASINDLKTFLPYLNNLDEKHQYLGMILKFYLKNGGFFLTKDQLYAAYESYIDSRSKKAIFSTKSMLADLNAAQRASNIARGG